MVKSKYLSGTKVTSSYSDKKYTLSGLESGYYLVKDKDATQSLTNDSYTRFIVEVVGADVEVAPKGNIPTIDKVVKDKNDTTGEEAWDKTADHERGDDVSYKITGTLPSDYDKYDQYYYEINDEFTKSTPKADTVKVYVQNGDTKTLLTSDDYTLITDTDSIQVKIRDLKKVDTNHTEFTITDSTKIIVEYDATLDSDAVIGGAGNPSEAYLRFSNDPNDESSWNSSTGEPENKYTGKTPVVKNIVFTYKIIVNKVDKDKVALPGAGFTLYKKYKKESGDEWVKVSDITPTETEKPTTFTFSGTDDGTYKIVETTVPSGYNKVSDIEFTVTATNNLMDPYITLSVDNTSVTADNSAGSLTTEVVNKTGVVLPGTGGIGTKLIYIAGILMVLAAGVLLVSRRRAGRM